jgi:ribosomal protein S18 acetylase RimI-like enzyme
MDSKIKTIEDLSLNAWPSHQIQYYDGWLLRFSYFYTHRTNCVEQVGESTIPCGRKIRYCEEEYIKWGTPAIFKISPLVDPSFDGLLEDRGYMIQHRTIVMVRDDITDLMDRSAAVRFDGSRHKEYGGVRLTCSAFIPRAWIDALFALKHTTNVMHKSIVPSMYRAIPKETLCVQVRDGSRFIGTGLGILDRNYAGVYAIHVHPDYRRRGIARQIVSMILEEAALRGVTGAYLQVVSDNEPAKRLYRGLGFREFYEYWFRVR